MGRAIGRGGWGIFGSIGTILKVEMTRGLFGYMMYQWCLEGVWRVLEV